MITEGFVSGSLKASRSTARSSTCSPSSSAEELDSYLAVCNALVQGSSAASLPLRTPLIHNLKSSPSVSSASLRASPPPRTPRDKSQGQSPRTGHHGFLSLRLCRFCVFRNVVLITVITLLLLLPLLGEGNGGVHLLPCDLDLLHQLDLELLVELVELCREAFCRDPRV